MRKRILVRLSLAFLAIFTFCSCRTDPFAEQEPYSNTSKFQLTSKRISLNEVKHKSIVLPELAKAKKGIETISTAHVNGKVISYGNGISIDTDDVIYIENGPNYHTYTFRIQRENAPQNAPIENLVLSPLPDGSYREILLQYTLTPAERQTLQYGGFVDMKNKSTVTILSGNSYQTGIFSKGQACIDITETYYTTCSENVHSHGETSPTCTASIKSIAYTVIKTLCYSDNGPATENPVDPANPNGGGSSGSGSNSDYECTDIPTDPTDLGLTNEEGCSLAIPSLPNLPGKETPCEKIKNTTNNTTGLKNKINELNTPQNLALNYEKGAAIEDDAQGQSQLVTNDGSPGNTYITVLVSETGETTGFVHTHFEGSTMLPVFSFEDLKTLASIYQWRAYNNKPLDKVTLMVISTAGVFAMVVEDPNLFLPQTYKIWGAEEEELYNKFYGDLKKKVNITYDDVIKQISKALPTHGVGLYKANADLSSWSRLTYNPTTDTVQPVPCN